MKTESNNSTTLERVQFTNETRNAVFAWAYSVSKMKVVKAGSPHDPKLKVFRSLEGDYDEVCLGDYLTVNNGVIAISKQ